MTEAAIMQVRQFQYNSAEKLRWVTGNRAPLHITWQHKRYATVVPTEMWEAAEAALRREQEREQQKQGDDAA